MECCWILCALFNTCKVCLQSNWSSHHRHGGGSCMLDLVKWPLGFFKVETLPNILCLFLVTCWLHFILQHCPSLYLVLHSTWCHKLNRSLISGAAPPSSASEERHPRRHHEHGRRRKKISRKLKGLLGKGESDSAAATSVRPGEAGQELNGGLCMNYSLLPRTVF